MKRTVTPGKIVLAAGTAAAFLVGELYLVLNPMFPFHFLDYVLPLALVLASAAGTWALYRDPAPVSARLLAGWCIALTALFLAANALVIREDGDPAALFCGSGLWSSVPLAGMTALACGCAIRRSAALAVRTKLRRGLILALAVLLAAYAGWAAWGILRASRRRGTGTLSYRSEVRTFFSADKSLRVGTAPYNYLLCYTDAATNMQPPEGGQRL